MIHSAVLTWVRRGVGGDQGPVQVQGGRAVRAGPGSRWTCRPPASVPRRLRGPGPGPPADEALGCLQCGPRAWSHPSTAITVLPSMAPIRVCNQDVRRASRPTGSRSCKTRRMVDWRRQGPPGLQTQGLQLSCLQVGGVLPDHHQALAPRQDPRHNQTQDRGQIMTHPPPIPRIDHTPKDLDQGLAREGTRGGR